MKSMYSLHYEDSLAHRDDNIMAHANPQLRHLASPIQAAQQAVAWILVAAQHDIARRDGVITAMRSRWWRQLCSNAIHLTATQAQQRRLQAWRCVIQKAQQLTMERLQLEENAKAAEIEKLTVQLEDWHQEQAKRAEAKKITEKKQAAQRAKEERRLAQQFRQYLKDKYIETQTGGVCTSGHCKLPKRRDDSVWKGITGATEGTFYQQSFQMFDPLSLCAECMLQHYESNHVDGDHTAPTLLREQAEELERLRGELHPSASEESAPSQPNADASTAAVHLLSTQLTEAERQWKTWQDKATQLERQLQATEQKHGATAVHCRRWQHVASDLEQQLKAMQQEFDQELAFGSELQHKFNQEQRYVVKLQQDAATLIQELQRLERNGIQVDWHQL